MLIPAKETLEAPSPVSIKVNHAQKERVTILLHPLSLSEQKICRVRSVYSNCSSKAWKDNRYVAELEQFHSVLLKNHFSNKAMKDNYFENRTDPEHFFKNLIVRGVK